MDRQADIDKRMQEIERERANSATLARLRLREGRRQVVTIIAEDGEIVTPPPPRPVEDGQS